MKKAKWEDLLIASPSGDPTPSFFPTIDDKIVFGNYTEKSLLGEVAKVPLLIGNNDYESGLFVIDFLIYNITDPVYGPYFDLCPYQLSSWAESKMPVLKTVCQLGDTAGLGISLV
jgi:hypothetical protein